MSNWCGQLVRICLLLPTFYFRWVYTSVSIQIIEAPRSQAFRLALLRMINALLLQTDWSLQIDHWIINVTCLYTKVLRSQHLLRLWLATSLQLDWCSLFFKWYSLIKTYISIFDLYIVCIIQNQTFGFLVNLARSDGFYQFVAGCLLHQFYFLLSLAVWLVTRWEYLILGLGIFIKVVELLDFCSVEAKCLGLNWWFGTFGVQYFTVCFAIVFVVGSWRDSLFSKGEELVAEFLLISL